MSVAANTCKVANKYGRDGRGTSLVNFQSIEACDKEDTLEPRWRLHSAQRTKMTRKMTSDGETIDLVRGVTDDDIVSRR